MDHVLVVNVPGLQRQLALVHRSGQAGRRPPQNGVGHSLTQEKQLHDSSGFIYCRKHFLLFSSE